MIYKNVEIYNAAELVENGDGSISWKRVPSSVHRALESEQGKNMAVNATGVELRFVLKGDRAVIRMCTSKEDGVFHVYRGGIQGRYDDHEVHKLVSTTAEDFVIEKSKNLPRLKAMTEKIGYDWDCEVIRVIFDRGFFKIFDITGDIEPPTKAQCPKKTLLSYGSSITHGSNSIDASHAWVSVLAHNLNMDARNLGMAGSCAMEPAIVDYIASEGEKGRWDIATLELGINVLDWAEEKILERVENTIRQVAGRNQEKTVFVISPFYYCGDDFEDHGHADKWRRLIEQVVKQLNYPNVTYINGLDILEDMSYMSADEVHPNIYGVQRIADKLTGLIGDRLERG
ncbi:MAG: hypothetical protein IJ390_00145 [Lachnospiraceae bacterium]|nr:hypothetical protein [Lachnospiraceae bacterium]